MASAAAAAAAPLLPSQEVFLEFRAGKMVREGRTVKPDTRKGLIRIVRGDEGLLHFQWLDRTQNVLEDDQIIFPEEAIFEKVQQSSGRVYILKYKHDDRTFFFWMQEPKGDGDAQICSSVNFYINQPLEPDQDEEAEGVAPPTLSETSGSVSGLEASSREASVEMMIPPPGNASVGGAAAVDGPVQLADLKRILSSIQQGGPHSEIPLTLPKDTGPSLAEILKPELVVPLLENCHLEEQLVPYLPEGPWTRETIIELMQSPQFHQQVEAFTQVLRSGQIDLAQFGIDPSKCDFTVSSFLEAIEDQVSAQTEPVSPSRDKRTDSDDDKSSDQNTKRDSDAMEEGR